MTVLALNKGTKVIHTDVDAVCEHVDGKLRYLFYMHETNTISVGQNIYNSAPVEDLWVQLILDLYGLRPALGRLIDKAKAQAANNFGQVERLFGVSETVQASEFSINRDRFIGSVAHCTGNGFYHYPKIWFPVVQKDEELRSVVLEDKWAYPAYLIQVRDGMYTGLEVRSTKEGLDSEYLQEYCKYTDLSGPIINQHDWLKMLVSNQSFFLEAWNKKPRYRKGTKSVASIMPQRLAEFSKSL